MTEIIGELENTLYRKQVPVEEPPKLTQITTITQEDYKTKLREPVQLTYYG